MGPSPRLTVMRPLHGRLRLAALVAVGALAVHQLRYVVAFGDHAPRRLASEGHAYLGSVAVIVGLLAAFALGLFLRRILLAWGSGSCEDGRTSGLRLWLATSIGLVAIFAGQELLEGLLASGHPTGLHGVFGHGGWVAVPLAVAIGGLVAAAARGAEAAVAVVASARSGTPRPGRIHSAPHLLPDGPPHRRLAPLAAAAASRAPPHTRLTAY